MHPPPRALILSTFETHVCGAVAVLYCSGLVFEQEGLLTVFSGAALCSWSGLEQPEVRGGR